jgi:hypothetical protein
MGATMARALLLTFLLLGACSQDDPRGVYDGTATVTMTSGNIVVTSRVTLYPDLNDAELVSTAGPPDLGCHFVGPTWNGSSVHYDCAQFQCDCMLETTDLTVTTASGTLSGDLLSLAFGGEVSGGGAAFSAAFMGTLEPGTR